MSDLPKKGDQVRVACVSCSKPGQPNFHTAAIYEITEPVEVSDKEGRLRIIGRRTSSDTGETPGLVVNALPELIQITKPFEETVAERIGE